MADDSPCSSSEEGKENGVKTGRENGFTAKTCSNPSNSNGNARDAAGEDKAQAGERLFLDELPSTVFNHVCFFHIFSIIQQSSLAIVK